MLHLRMKKDLIKAGRSFGFSSSLSVVNGNIKGHPSVLLLHAVFMDLKLGF